MGDNKEMGVVDSELFLGVINSICKKLKNAVRGQLSPENLLKSFLWFSFAGDCRRSGGGAR